MTLDPRLIAEIAEEVAARLEGRLAAAPARPSGDGVYATVDEAVKAAARAQQRIADMSLEERGRIVAIIRRMCTENAAEWARIELDETRLGRLDHKIEKLKNIRFVPGVEAMRSEVRTDA
jgi:aldehyde dehydrogenase